MKKKDITRMKNYTAGSFQIRNPQFAFLCAIRSIRFYEQRIKNVKKKYNKKNYGQNKKC